MTRAKASNRSSTPWSLQAVWPPGPAKDDIAQSILAVARSVLGNEVALNQPLMEAGLDSLGSVELRNQLSSRFSVELPATVTFDYPTAAAMAGLISGKHGVLPDAGLSPCADASTASMLWSCQCRHFTFSAILTIGQCMLIASRQADGRLAWDELL